MVRSQLNSLRKAQNTKRQNRKRAAFTADPYRFARSLLDKERYGVLETSIEEVEQYLHDTHSGPKREYTLGDCDRIDPVEPPENDLVITEPTLGEFKEVTKKTRSASAPNAIQYKVFKMCPLLRKRLWTLERGPGEMRSPISLKGGRRNIHVKGKKL